MLHSQTQAAADRLERRAEFLGDLRDAHAERVVEHDEPLSTGSASRAAAMRVRVAYAPARSQARHVFDLIDSWAW